MNLNAGHVRVSSDQDRDRILVVHRSAFGDDEGPVIAHLVEEMLDDPSGEPILSLVAELDDVFVGHALFTSVNIEPSQQVSARILAPLAVTRDHHGQGIGSLLVQEGFKRLAEAGVELVFVLGYPGYYLRFGFVPAESRGFHAPYPVLPKNAVFRSFRDYGHETASPAAITALGARLDRLVSPAATKSARAQSLRRI